MPPTTITSAGATSTTYASEDGLTATPTSRQGGKGSEDNQDPQEGSVATTHGRLCHAADATALLKGSVDKCRASRWVLSAASASRWSNGRRHH